MSEPTCREVFSHGAGASDLALVEGTFCCPRGGGNGSGSSLDTLCGWLDLPRVVVIDVSHLDCCRLTCQPPSVDAVLLDRVVDRSHARRWQTTFEVLWRVPVLGYLEELPAIRAQMLHLPYGSTPSSQFCRALGDQLTANLDCQRLLQIASRREFPLVTPRLFCPLQLSQQLNVAVAFDEAFHCYFPDTLDLLEMRGATLHDFSPIHSERLPLATDVVYLGCGPAAQYAEVLASNHCLKQALRNHVRRGGRIYAEGSGLAYLAQQMLLPGGRCLAMSGILPLMATYHPAPRPTRAIELTLVRDNWLGRRSARLRGYWNSNWSIQPMRTTDLGQGRPEPTPGLVGRHQVIGSCLNLDFAAQPEFIDSFFQPVPPPGQVLQAS